MADPAFTRRRFIAGATVLGLGPPGSSRPVGLSTVNCFYGAQYAQVMALAILGALPLLIAFLFFQRQIVQGIANTGLKG